MTGELGGGRLTLGLTIKSSAELSASPSWNSDGRIRPDHPAVTPKHVGCAGKERGREQTGNHLQDRRRTSFIYL